jgi:hypothetical protein
MTQIGGVRLRSCDVHGAPNTAALWRGHDWGRRHEIQALEDDTRIINMFVNGVPNEWDAMAVKTEINTDLTHRISEYSNPVPELVNVPNS